MKNSRYISLALVLLTMIAFCKISTAQSNAGAYFTVEGEVAKPLKLSIEDLSRMEQTEVTARDRDGNNHQFNGVLLYEILKAAGVTLGEELRGENLTKYLLIQASDGYEVIFSLPEVDPEFTDQKVLLAYGMDGSPLPAGTGPFRLIAPSEKRQARWIRELSNIKVVFSVE